MIEINLLPEKLRKVESTPLPRQLTIYLGVALSAGMIFLNWFFFNETDKAEEKLAKVKVEISSEQNKIKQLEALALEIDAIKKHVNTVENLYRNRTIWAKVLFDLKNIMHQQEFNNENEDREYLWLKELKLEDTRTSGGGFGVAPQKTKTMKLNGYASAKGTRRATMMIRNLIDSMVGYTPEKSPEEEALENLEERLELRKELDEKLKTKGKKKKKLSEQEERKLRAEDELIRHLQDKKSGGVATMPFMEFFNEATRDVKLKWSDRAPSASGGKSKEMKMLPLQAMGFEIKLSFKPKVKKAVTPGF
ncbi:MAG: PilN domain-containing protein [Planctomycetota bacterium]|jgi:Tfp pilus assembly protein PilN